VLRGQHVSTASSAVTFVHLAAPVVPFTDRGKTAIVVAPVITKALIDTVRKVTADWHAEHEAENRAHSRRQRAAEREEKAEAKANTVHFTI